MKPDKFIIEYLEGRDYTSPTDIGKAYGEFKHGVFHHVAGYHSGWASPRCKRLVRDGVLQRNKLGHYRIRPDSHCGAKTPSAEIADGKIEHQMITRQTSDDFLDDGGE